MRNGFDGGAAPAPVRTFVQLTQRSDAGVVFSSSCSPTLTGLQLDAGATRADLFLRAFAPEVITLGTHNDDYPDFTLEVRAQGGEADAGRPDAARLPTRLAVGCGCGKTPGSALLALLALTAVPGAATPVRRRSGFVHSSKTLGPDAQAKASGNFK